MDELTPAERRRLAWAVAHGWIVVSTLRRDQPGAYISRMSAERRAKIAQLTAADFQDVRPEDIPPDRGSTYAGWIAQELEWQLGRRR